MNYSNFINQKQKYDDILTQRLQKYCELKSTQLDTYSDYEEYSNRDEWSTNIEYCSYGIEIKFERTYSGCGTDNYEFTAPLDILELDEDTFFENLRNEITESNKKYNIKKAKEEELQDIEIAADKRERDLRTLKRLQEEYKDTK